MHINLHRARHTPLHTPSNTIIAFAYIVDPCMGSCYEDQCTNNRIQQRHSSKRYTTIIPQKYQKKAMKLWTQQLLHPKCAYRTNTNYRAAGKATKHVWDHQCNITHQLGICLFAAANKKRDIHTISLFTHLQTNQLTYKEAEVKRDRNIDSE